jgi:beta-glucanase (GH16 family)
MGERARRERGWRRFPGPALVAAVAACLACGLEAPEDPAANGVTRQTLPPAGYQLAWADEFNGSTLDAAKWTALTGVRGDAVMTAQAAQVRGGVLTMRTYTDRGRHRTPFLTTEGRYLTTYGYFEARILFTDSPGEWCAFWLNSPTNGVPLGDPANAGVEIDVVEHRVTDQGGWTALRDMVALNLNWDGYDEDKKNAQRVLALPDGSAIQGAWRTFGVLWTEQGYTFYVDGLPLWSTSEAVSQRPEAIYLTCEVDDGGWAGDVPPGGYGAREASTTGMHVDWVRVWQAGR